MTRAVYLLGAGVNQFVTRKYWNGYVGHSLHELTQADAQVSWLVSKPPLANNFFQLALNSRISEMKGLGGKTYYETIIPLLDYISNLWKKSEEDLHNHPFNLEDCFTMLQLESRDAQRKRENQEFIRLARLELTLKSFLAAYLSEFDIITELPDAMNKFGSILHQEKPTIITLNYDCILETILERTSGSDNYRNNVKPPYFRDGGILKGGEISDADLSYSLYNWNRALAYGIKFNEVELPWGGKSFYMDGSRFYDQPANELYSCRILKLHGSLNWFNYFPIKEPQFVLGKLPKERMSDVLLINNANWVPDTFPSHNGWLINPLIVTPVLYKEESLQHQLLQDIWRQASECLSRCNRLVVIGYSFAPTDFNVRRLLLEAFANNTLKELVVVNPDTSVIEVAKELSHFKAPVVSCGDLEEYLAQYNDSYS